MAGNKDVIDILREIRGTGVPGETYTNGIWYELTIADIDGNPGIYGDILAKYGVIAENSPTLEQAVAILQNLNVVVTSIPPGNPATSELVDGVWQLGIPRGSDGADGTNGLTPVPEFSYNALTGDIEYTTSYILGNDPIITEEW